MHPVSNGIVFWVANLALCVAAQHCVHPLRHDLSGSQGGLVGVCAFYAVYVAWNWFRQSGVISSRESAGMVPNLAHQYPYGA